MPLIQGSGKQAEKRAAILRDIIWFAEIAIFVWILFLILPDLGKSRQVLVLISIFVVGMAGLIALEFYEKSRRHTSGEAALRGITSAGFYTPLSVSDYRHSHLLLCGTTDAKQSYRNVNAAYRHFPDQVADADSQKSAPNC